MSDLMSDDHVTGYAAIFGGNMKYCDFIVSELEQSKYISVIKFLGSGGVLVTLSFIFDDHIARCAAIFKKFMFSL